MRKIILLLVFLPITLFSAEMTKQERLAAYLKALVAMQTVTSDTQANLQALQWVEDELRPYSLYVKQHTFNGHSAMVITTQDTKQPKVLLAAHIDVVPAPQALFHPEIKNDRMYGRGTYDMKMAVACYMLLMEELQGARDLDIGIMLTSDEEVGGMNGVKRLLEEGYSSRVVLLPDGGFDWNFEEAAKGVLHVRLSSYGSAAHSSRPWTGRNAINQLLAALREINSYFENEKVGEYYPTGNVGIIQGGKAINQVPDFAEAKIDIRFPPSMTSDKIYADLQHIVSKQPHVTLDKIIEASSHKADLEQNYYKTFRQIAKELYGIEVGKSLSHGSSDARFFGEKDIPVLVITSQGGEIHSDSEWVDLPDLVRFYEVMKRWVLENS